MKENTGTFSMIVILTADMKANSDVLLVAFTVTPL